jgi:uncharacterized membrane protein YbaN (DUF454 family)
MSMAQDGQPAVSGMRRWPYLLLAWVALALGLVGIVLPGLPTTPFVLLAAWAAARGSTRLHRWLRVHRLFGPMIREWEAQGAVNRRAKWMATLMMAASAAIFFLTAPKLWMAATGTAIMAVVATWLWLRPEPKPKPKPKQKG